MSIGIGETLRQAREEQGRSTADAAQSLRIRTDYVDAMEEEDFGVFGADTYARGHLRNYARLLGLDPEPLLDQYDRYVRTEDQTAHRFADAPVAIHQREPLPRWVTGLGVTIAIIAAIALIGVIGSRTPEPADIDVLPSASDTPSPTPSASPTPSPEPTSEPSPSPTFEGVDVTLAVESDCWVDIRVDGQPHPRSNSVLTSGETVQIEGDEEVVITYGNAGGVVVQYNGEVLGPPGGPGQVVTVTYGQDEVQPA